MDLTIFGVRIDPTGAEEGERRATAAATRTAEGFESADRRVTAATTRTREATRRVGQDTRQGMETAERAVEALPRTAAPAFERFRQTATAAATGVRSAFGSMGQSVVDLATGLGLMNSPVGNMILRITSLGRVLGNFSGSTRDATAAVAGAGTAAAASAGGFSALMAVAMPLVAVMATLAAGLVGLGAALSLIKTGINLAGEIETVQSAMVNLIGSTSKAAEVMEKLKAKSELTGVAMIDQATAVRRFIALGFDPDKALALNTAILDVSGAFGLTAAQANLVANALGQVQSKGVASMEELRQQIGEQGIPMFQALAQSVGVTEAALIKMIGEGKISADQVINTFLQMEGAFAIAKGGAERMGMTWEGVTGRIKQAWNNTLILLGAPIKDALKPLLVDFLGIIQRLQPEAKAVGDAIAGAVKQVQAAMQVLTSNGGLSLSWNAAAEMATDTLRRGMEAAGIILGALVQKGIYEGLKLFDTVTKASFWKGLEDTLYNAAAGFVNAITEGIRKAANALLEVAKLINPLLAAFNPKGFEAMILRQPGTQAFMNGQAAPTVPSPAAAWAQTQAQPGPATQQWQAQQQANLNAINAASAPTVVENPRPFGSSSNEQIQEGKKTDLLKQLQSQADAIIKGIESPMEKLNRTMKELEMLRDNGLLSMEQFGRASVQAKDEYLKSLEEMAEKARTPLQKLLAEWGNLKKQTLELSAGMAEAVSHNMTAALTDLVNGTKSATEAFDAMASAILADITQMIIKMLVQYAIQTALGWVGVSSAPSAGAMAAVHHTGGTVGDSGTSRAASPTAWANAPRYAIGGTVPGVSSGERAIIAEPGETVLTREQTAKLRDRMGETSKGGKSEGQQSLTIANFTDPEEFRRYLEGNRHVIVNIIAKERSMVRSVLQGQ